MPYDFVAGSLTYSLSWSDPFLNQDDFLEIRYSAFQVGTIAYSGPVRVRVFLSEDATFGAGDRVLVDYTHSVSGSFFFGLTAPTFVPQNLAPGRYNLIMEVDPRNLIAEANEADNQTIVSDVVVNGSHVTNRAAADLFETHGKLAFMAKLAAAAYHLTAEEPDVRGINHSNAAVDPIFASLAAELTMLDQSDLPALQRLDFPGQDFPVSGLRNGIYTHQNSAALVARSADAMFLAFRGTNDNNGDYGFPFSPAPETPDGDHWTNKGAHFAQFEAMFAAVFAYMEEFGLTDLYVTGHSLGAAMAQAFMANNSGTDIGGINIHADAFANPGYGPGITVQDDSRMTNLYIQGDPILGAAALAVNRGDINTIHHNLRDQIIGLPLEKEGIFGLTVKMTNKEKLGLLHSATYYVEFAEALQSAGIGDAELSGKALHGIDFDTVYVNAVVSGNGNTVVVGGEADSITGGSSSDILLGMAGKDTLMGMTGRDHIDGGAHNDMIYGGWGQDYLKGGSGSDRFIFRHSDYFGVKAPDDLPNFPATPRSLNDTILDFEAGIDKIHLAEIDPSLAAGNQAFVFLGRTAYTGAAGELRWGQLNGNTLVQGDMTGDGKSDFTITLLGLHTLQASDFVL